MATFKVGQRVRYTAGLVNGKQVTGDHLIGAEAVIVRAAPSNWDWVIKGDALRDGVSRGLGLAPDEIQADSCQLTPLIDPRAESFIADMNRFARLAKKPLADRILAHVKGGA